ncbi:MULTISPECIES: serine/threonine-protein kinase [unclassified Mesorhizobium]|uniref:serine/threonine-protein kinase n=1 Tax=unclassified Mesorhizobium TaxID=325217 RepID=UPI0030148D0E
MTSDGKTRIAVNRTTLEPGTQLNDTYEIDARIASGGMGEVYRGHNIQTGEPVAIKTILPELADDDAIFALFKKEATILGRLHHETIVRYYSFSRDPRLGRPYLAMEFVDGQSLADRIAISPLDASEARRLFIRVADGLALAHRAGVIHRDLSPDNIILQHGDVSQPKIIDFGIARSANVGGGTLIGGNFAGKYNFVSPEQLGIKNLEVTARSDLYSLGLVIAAALRGAPLDMGGSHVEVIDKRRAVPDLTDLDPGLRPLVQAMLQPEEDDRPDSAEQVAAWLRSAKIGSARPASTGSGSADAATQPPDTLGSHSPFGNSAPSSGSLGRHAAALEGPTSSPSLGMGPPPSSAPVRATSRLNLAGSSATPRPSKTALMGGLLVLLLAGGAGGAYFLGLFGQFATSETTSQPSAPQIVVQQEPEEQPSGPSLDDILKEAESKTPPQNAEPKPQEEAKTTPEAKPGESAPASPPVVVTPPATESETTPKPGDAPPAETDPKQAEPSLPQRTPTETKEAALDMVETAEQSVSWLRSYDGGRCFFAAVTTVSDQSIDIKGFGLTKEPFERLYNSLKQKSTKEPEVNGQLITDAQCAVTEFLNAVQPTAKDSPSLTLLADRLKPGENLVATVGKKGTRNLDLLLVDSDGFVYNMGSFATKVTDGDKETFELKFQSARLRDVSPEMVIALASDQDLGLPAGRTVSRAADLFPKLARKIDSMNGSFGVDFGYFLVTE